MQILSNNTVKSANYVTTACSTNVAIKTSGKSFPSVRWSLAKHNWDRAFQRRSWHSGQTGFVHQTASWGVCCHRAQSWVTRSTPGQCRRHRQSTIECSVALSRLDEQHMSTRHRSIRACQYQSDPEAVIQQQLTAVILLLLTSSCIIKCWQATNANTVYTQHFELNFVDCYIWSK